MAQGLNERIAAEAGREFGEYMLDFKKDLATASVQDLAQATPWDTHRAAFSWWLGINRINDDGDDRADPNLHATIQRESVEQLSRLTNDDDIWLSNAVSYIVYLNQGSSRQAPAGFVEDTIAKTAQRIYQKYNNRSPLDGSPPPTPPTGGLSAPPQKARGFIQRLRSRFSSLFGRIRGIFGR